MRDGKIVVARLFDQFDGRTPSRAGVITRLDRRKFETICIFLEKLADSPNYFEDAEYTTYYLADGKVKGLVASLRAVRCLAEILKSTHADILQCHRHKAAVIGTFAAALAKTPAVIAQVHGLGRTRNWRRKMINRLIFRRVAKIITVGQAVRDDVIRTNAGVSPDKVWSEGNSIEYDRFAGVSISKQEANERLQLSADSIVFGTVGRMAKNKGQAYLMRAFAIVKKALPSAQLIFAGDGELRGELEAQARRMDCGESIRFLGYRRDIPQVLRAMDVFVLSSVGSEGIPRAMLEAMAAGIPCVGTDISGIPEILDNGKFGFVVPPWQEDALAEAMIKCARTGEYDRQKNVTAAQERVRCCYTHEIVAGKLEKVYAEVYENCK